MLNVNSVFLQAPSTQKGPTVTGRAITQMATSPRETQSLLDDAVTQLLWAARKHSPKSDFAKQAVGKTGCAAEGEGFETPVPIVRTQLTDFTNRVNC